MKEFNFSTLVKRSDYYTPESLMHNYVKLHPSMRFGYLSCGKAYLDITGTRYYYDHWKTIAVSPQSEMVTVYLTDNTLVPMPGIEGDWGKKHWCED